MADQTRNAGPRRVCLVGAGNISQIHAEALREVPGAELVAVCDPDRERAQQLAAEYDAVYLFGSVEEVIASGCCDFAHVLVPPALHRPVAESLLSAGIGVFVEKPLAVSRAECESIVESASRGDAALGINHSALFYPAYLELRELIRSRAYGPLHHLTVTLAFPRASVPPPGHFLLQRPENLAYESGAHPFAQIRDLAGRVASVNTTVSGRRELGDGRHWFDTWQVAVDGEDATAQLVISYRGGFSTWELMALCEDGILTADLEHNRVSTIPKSRAPVYFQRLDVGARLTGAELGRTLRNAAADVRGALRPNPRRDAYYVSMRDSIRAFHVGPAPGQPAVDGRFATEVVAMCDAAAEPVAATGVADRDEQRRDGQGRTGRKPCDAVVIGGTGFIGRNVVEQMAAAGLTVRVMARGTDGLDDLFRAPGVDVMAGDVADPEAIDRAIDGARLVVHLAHGGRFTWETVDSHMIEPARRIAEACLRNDVERLVYAGSIASLYLGDPNTVITGETPNDPRARERGFYSWAKARNEEDLGQRAREDGLPLSILRPGVVLGPHGNPYHSGFGNWRGDIHCIGWNQGTNPLPLVLAWDVATAIMLALESPAAVGRTFNLVGDIRLNARECVAELRRWTGRPLRFHPRYPEQLYALELLKWGTRRLVGRPWAELPSIRPIKSLACQSPFDTSDVKHALGWKPEGDRQEFIRRALHV